MSTNRTTRASAASDASKTADAPLPGWMSMSSKDNESRSQREHYRKTSKSIVRVSAAGSSRDDGLADVRSDDELLSEDGDETTHGQVELGIGDGGLPEHETGDEERSPVVYRSYRRRWFGLVQLILLNIIVSWDWLSFAPVSTTASQYFGATASSINWLATAFMFAFVVVSPLTIYVLHRGGPRPAIIIAAVLLLLGNWIRYGGTRSNSFDAVMFGQILTGLAQPFVLSAPTRYSDLWFTGNGRIAATAIMSLANPFGGALGQLIDPFWASEPEDIPDMVLYIAIISSIAAIPSFFIPAAPPTPCSPSSAVKKEDLVSSILTLLHLPEFYMIFIPFTVYVGFFNSISSLLNQILEPYGFTETSAGIAGAVLIVVGLIASAIMSPIIDRSKKYLLAIKIQVPIIALCYLAFIWAPPTGSMTTVYIILAVLGAASFGLVPIVLEYIVEITHPISPEVTSSVCWSGGQLLGGCFILISNALTDGSDGGRGGSAPYNMQRALWFQATIALCIAPLPLALGLFGREKRTRLRRVEADKSISAPRASDNMDNHLHIFQ